ncbi:UvrD-helicase domain-containing protein [Nonomuraea sp. MCN248]|uniref:DNA 3'-5' helicase n=1 Tax=Nonomuraea corallina TaxID=2989783 RepID=A0ABT4SD83_9ACTN|nr:UvrD-helicase domain-containing protein [Nonomuraea corallina]MDA0635167.1 UvrD-helicase domain-containing protein [Nonomuraea corallina]
MSDAYVGTPALTAEQRAVVEQPADALTLVTAQAGAGKTHTLVRRLDRLVAEEDLIAGEILVLTFSRAAVRELKSRLDKYGDAARHVRAQTFDSWALDLLMRVDAQGSWLEKSFDARIEGAQETIDHGLADELYEHDLRHVVIDEVQDLVGARRELVEALLDRFDCGFTVVGDPAQSIYGFTVKNSAERKQETNRFFEWLRSTFGEDLTELSLTDSFRARTDEAKTALDFGPRLRMLSESGNVDGEAHYNELRKTLTGVMNFGGFDELAADALTSFSGTSAILCRTNGQALMISEKLHAVDVPHRLQRSARDRVAPMWLGLLLARSHGASLNREKFDECVGDLPLVEGSDPEVLWRLLQRTGTGHGSDRVLDLARLRSALAAGRLPDELIAQPPARLVVSSFHRAKGLEFDRVLVVDPGPLRERTPEDSSQKGDKDPAEEARLLYVAMTRARDELYLVPPLDMRNIRIHDVTDRWARYFFQRWRRDGLELQRGDVTTDYPAGSVDFEADAADVQHYLATAVRPGDAVELERVYPEPIGLLESPPYLVKHEGRPIGTASEKFRRDLYRFLKLGPSFVPYSFPSLISSVRIDTVETVAGVEAAGIRAGLDQHGVWLAPRLVGLSTFTWDKKELDVEAQ